MAKAGLFSLPRIIVYDESIAVTHVGLLRRKRVAECHGHSGVDRGMWLGDCPS